MLTDIGYAVLRAAAAFVLLLIVTRLMGRKVVSQMTFFDFCVGIALGSVTADMSFGKEDSFHTGIAILFTMGFIAILFGFLYMKSMSFRKLVNSEPVILIENNQIVEKNMKRTRLTLTELTALLREKNAFDIGDVEYAVLENDGKLSVLLKSDRRPATPADFQRHPPEGGLTKDIIIDGNIMYENLRSTNMTDAWLFEELKKRGIQSAGEVFFAALDASGGLYVSRGINGKERRGMHGLE